MNLRREAHGEHIVNRQSIGRISNSANSLAQELARRVLMDGLMSKSHPIAIDLYALASTVGGITYTGDVYTAETSRAGATVSLNNTTGTETLVPKTGNGQYANPVKTSNGNHYSLEKRGAGQMLLTDAIGTSHVLTSQRYSGGAK